MAIAFETSGSVAAGTGTLTWTLTSAAPRGITVLVNVAGGTDDVGTVTANGIVVPEVTGSPQLKAGTETMENHVFHLGTGILGTQQTIVVAALTTTSKRAVAISQTASNDTEVHLTHTTYNTTTASEPVAQIMSLGSTPCYVTTVFGSGIANPANATVSANWTLLLEHDYGPQIAEWHSYSTITSGDVTIGYPTSDAPDDSLLFGIAIRESAAGAPPSNMVSIERHYPRGAMRGVMRGVA